MCYTSDPAPGTLTPSCRRQFRFRNSFLHAPVHINDVGHQSLSFLFMFHLLLYRVTTFDAHRFLAFLDCLCLPPYLEIKYYCNEY